jgi:hypothetical protein
VGQEIEEGGGQAQARAARQLRRLERFMDVVFALAIWHVFSILPMPDPDHPQWDTVLEMLIAEWARFVTSLIGILILVVYWLQNNALFNKRQGGYYRTRCMRAGSWSGSSDPLPEIRIATASISSCSSRWSIATSTRAGT